MENGVVFQILVQLLPLLINVLGLQISHVVRDVMLPTLMKVEIGVLKTAVGVVLVHLVRVTVLLLNVSPNQITHAVNQLVMLSILMIMVSGVLKMVNGVVFQTLAQLLLRINVLVSLFFQYVTTHYQLVLLYTINVVVMVTTVQLNVVRENVLHKDLSKFYIYIIIYYCCCCL